MPARGEDEGIFFIKVEFRSLPFNGNFGEPFLHFGNIYVHLFIPGAEVAEVVIRVGFPDPETLGVIHDCLEYLLAHKRAFVEAGAFCRFPETEMIRIIESTLDSIDLVIQNVSSKLPKDFPHDISNPIFEFLAKMKLKK